ncbi:MAG: hypothetical protein RBR15_04495 [Sphaerochaeta sp.]|nr:hypothetical protein [Sphaerochaeta sp.]
MANPTFFHFSEHSLQDKDDLIQMSEVIVEPDVMVPPEDQRAKYLGVYQEGRFFKADYYIGLRWVSWKGEDNIMQLGVIQTRPKRSSGIPFMKLLLKCLSDETVSQHLGECYRLFPDEPMIPSPLDDKDYITPLIMCEFLVRIKKIIKKGIKRNFQTHKKVLSNNIKGRINVKESLRLNISQTSIPRVSCRYQVNSLNCLENRILKTTLLKIDSYCKSMYIAEPEIQNLLAYAMYGFQEIDPIDVSNCNFAQLNESPFFKEYKPTLALAKILLKTFTYPVYSQEGEQKRCTIPFYINMPELFERYCEVLLRAQYANVKAGYQFDGYSETRCGHAVPIRPDFLLPDENMIVDSKYKYWGEFVRREGISKEDIAQLSLYARHEGVLRRLGEHPVPPRIQFVYPKDTGKLAIDFSNSANEKVKDIVDCFTYPLRISSDDI